MREPSFVCGKIPTPSSVASRSARRTLAYTEGCEAGKLHTTKSVATKPKARVPATNLAILLTLRLRISPEDAVRYENDVAASILGRQVHDPRTKADVRIPVQIDLHERHGNRTALPDCGRSF